jgi:hypothetical protein
VTKEKLHGRGVSAIWHTPPRADIDAGLSPGFVRAIWFIFASAQIAPSNDALPSCNEGSAKQAMLDFMRDSTDRANPKFVPPEERIATFDQDGTPWVEHPVYSQMMYCLDRVPALTAQRPALKDVEPFKTVLSQEIGRS